MAFNKRNTLERIIEIQNIVLEHQRRGVPQTWVYHNVVRKRFYIAYATFKNYMARNARRELKELNENEEVKEAK